MASSMLTAEVSSSASKDADIDEAFKSALHSCANDPDFAIVCDFLQKFSNDLGLDLPNFKLLLQWLTKTDEVSPQLREMQIKLLRKTRKTVHEKRWESALSKFCFTYSAQDAWEVERFGYKNSNFKVKLRILRELLECQFERNNKFRAKILTLSSDSLRSKPIGRDSLGHAYWITQDNDCNIRIYQEHLDEEIWQVVATNRDEFVNLIKRLKGSEVVLPSKDIGIVDEDTSSSNSTRNDLDSAQKVPQFDEKNDSQGDEQKVPKLSIKLVQDKNTKETIVKNVKDPGKGEEELAAEEDAKQLKKSNIIFTKANESGEEEFEEVEEEYEDESDSVEEESEDDDYNEDHNDKISEINEKMNEKKLQSNEKTEKNIKVKPLVISQNKVLNKEIGLTSSKVGKKRTLNQIVNDAASRNDNKNESGLKKSRPSLMDSKRLKTVNKYEDRNEESEEDYEDEEEETANEDGDVEEEVEEEDIDSVAAEEDENEEKQLEDYDDDDEEDEVGEEIRDPVLRVTGEGSGLDCDVENFLHFIEYNLLDDYSDNEIISSEVIVDDVSYVWGEGSGKDCLVGNKNKNDNDNNATNINSDTTTEVVSETKLKNDIENQKTNKTTLILGQKESVPNDESNGETTALTKDLEDKKENSKEKGVNEIVEQVFSKDENSKVNGENMSKENIDTETLEKEKQLDKNEGYTKLAFLSDNSKISEEKIENPLPKQIPDINLKTTKKTSVEVNIISQQTHANKMSALESLKKELRESKQKLLEKKTISTVESSIANHTNAAGYNRKRRLTDQLLTTTTTRLPNSESELDVNSENPEDLTNDKELDIEDDDNVDIGGKRLKMRPKQTNSELRKKIEAQKVAANDETSSSGGEEELRRRKKIMLTVLSQPTTKFKDVLKKIESQNDDETITDIGEKLSYSVLNTYQASVKKQITPTKVKPTLDEIIEKKLKKTPEKNEKELTSTTAKSLFPSLNKNSSIKPIKKTLLTQIRQEESDEEAIPQKGTNSQESSQQTTTDIKQLTELSTSNAKVLASEKPRITPERQRKRRSSEETTQNESPDEPEAKKEVTATIKDKNITAKRDKPSDSIKEEVTNVDVEDIEIKKECLTHVTSRRSGRRSLPAPAYSDTLQPKRNIDCTKNTIKKELNDCQKVVKVIKEEALRKETEIRTVLIKQVVEKKNDVDKSSEDKTISNSKKDKESFNVKKESKSDEIDTITTAKRETSKVKSSPTTKTPIKAGRKKREVDTINIIDIDNETPVRQSRRIAQQKIREEAERRKLEEIALRTMKQELKKKKKAEKQADPTVVPPTEPSSESEESDVETKRKVQKKKCPGKNGNWSSGSEEPDEEDEEPPHYETEPGSPLFKSDHEFSPESDIEDESQVVPMKRARTVRKEDANDDTLAADEEEACQKCNKSDHPEWILLCDNCDKGYHCSCLSPVLFYIPEGDWYCPPCQQEQLIKALEIQLKEFDNFVESKKMEEEQKKRLAEEEKARQEKEEEGTKKRKIENNSKAKCNNDNSSFEDNSHDEDDNDNGDKTCTNSDGNSESQSNKQFTRNKNRNRSHNNDKRNKRDRRPNATRNRRNRLKKRGCVSDGDSQSSNKSQSESNSNSSSTSSSSTYSDSDNEPIYKLRKRRQINVSYRLNEYDDLINSALKKEMDEAAGAGNLGRGKDISTIIEADKEEKARQKHIEDTDGANGEETSTKLKENDTKKVESVQDSKEIYKKTEPKETTSNKEEIGSKKSEDEDDSDAEPIIRKFNIKPTQKKKPRKLTKLDISSEDDNASDEDFKGSSFDDDDEEDTSISASNSDSSLEIYRRHGKSKKKRRKAARRAFRERRKDRKFVVDESDDEEVQRPKSKKKRKDDTDYTESEADDDDISELSENIDSADLCDDTSTDESDGAWRPNKRKKATKSNTLLAHKSPKSKSVNTKKPKKVEYSDDDVSESEEEEEDDDENDNVGSGKGMGKQPRSQPLKTSFSSTKTKGKGKEKTIAKPKTKKKKKSSDDEDSQSGSEDSTRRTRGRRYAYIEDFDDDSSDGGIKPGVQRPDTPPEEREKFIKRQEEIKRMLAEKNAEGAKLVATPRLTPIKTDCEKDKRSPVKVGGDSLSTVPLSVIRQAKVLDIDYLQRRGENLDDLSNDMAEVDGDFDDADLPDDFPDDMDEDAIARMVDEEEEFGAAAAKELPAPDEVLRTATKLGKIEEIEKPVLKAANIASSFTTNSPQVAPPATQLIPASGLQEPVRKRLPMPTMHPPLLRHQYLMHESISNTHHLMQRHHGGPPSSHLLQNALSAPLTQPLDRNYPPTNPSTSHHSLINRMIHNIPLQPTVSQALSTTRPSQTPSQISSSLLTKSALLLNHPSHEKPTNHQTITENKPRGRRKKITPLRDTLQKQQTAAAVTAATTTNSALASAIGNKKSESVGTSIPSSVIKSGPSPTKLPIPPNVIPSVPSTHPVTSRPGISMPPISGAYVRTDNSRFYDSPGNRISQANVQRHRGPLQMPPSLLQPHPANRSSYGPPPPLKGSSSVPSASAPSSTSNTPNSIRTPMHHVPTYLGMPPNVRHVSPHLNIYRPPIYGNPNFGPRVNLRPPNINAPEYSNGSRAYQPYGFYPPPPPLTTPGGQRSGPGLPPRPPTQAPPVPSALASVIVSATAGKSSNTPTATPMSNPERIELSSSSKPAVVAHELTGKVNPSKTSTPTSIVSQNQKSLVAVGTTVVPVAELPKKLTTLQAFTTNTSKKSPVQSVGNSPGSRSPSGGPAEASDDSLTPGPSENAPTSGELPKQGQAGEFSGLVSYFSSQHDDYNT